MNYWKYLLIILLGNIPVTTLLSGQTPYLPGQAEILQRYKKVQLRDSITRKTVSRHNVDASWLPGDASFWYPVTGKDSSRIIYRVNAATGKKTVVTDTNQLSMLTHPSAGTRPLGGIFHR
jgi:hypothetical protein